MSIKSNFTKAIGLGVVVAALSAGGAFAAVATSSTNVHSGPGIKFHTVDRLHSGDYVRITDRTGSWCEVRGEADGWVNCGVLANDRVNTYPDHQHRSYQPYHSYESYDRGPSFSFGVGPSGPSFGFNSGNGY